MNLMIWDSIPDKITETDAAAKWILTQEEFNDCSSFTDAEGIYILAELDWFGSNAPSAFYGFELLKRLRLDGIRTPIYMCSFLPKAYFLSLGKVPFGYLNLPFSNTFIQLPAIIPLKVHLGARLLSPEQLEDANYHFSNPHGLLDEQFHYLKDQINYHPQEAIQQALQEIRKVIPRSNLSDFEALAGNLREDVKRPHASLTRLVSQYKPAFKELLAKSPVFSYVSKAKSPWHVLFIDDNAEQRDTVKSELGKRGIPCFTAGSGEEAFDILRKDYEGRLQPSQDGSFSIYPKNSITVVISDLRLRSENEDWHALQGYDIINHIYSEMPNFVSFFILTTKRATIMKSASTFKQARVKWFSKEDVLFTGTDSGFNLFCQQIKEDGDNVNDIICSFPKAKYWADEAWKGKINYPLKDHYRHFRLSSNYDAVEKWLSDCALAYIEEAEMVQDKLFPKKGKVSTLDFPFLFKAGLPHAPSEPETMKKFHIKLIGRRIAIGLFLKGWELGAISDILKYQEIRHNPPDRQLFSAYLALSTNLEGEIPSNLLVEEREWVENQLGYSLSPVDKNFYYALQLILEEVQDLLRDKGCPNDFVDEPILIGSSRHCLSYVTQAAKLAREYGVNHFLSEKLKRLFFHKRFQQAVKRNNVLGVLERITGVLPENDVN